MDYTVTDGKGGNFAAQKTITINPVNDVPVKTAGDVVTLNLLEDAAATSLGLAGVTYSPGGGIDETTTPASKQALVYKAKTLPNAALGKVILANGTAVTANQTLDIDQLRGLKFEPAANAFGTGDFVFTVTDGGTNNNTAADEQTLTQTITINIKAFNDTPVVPSAGIKFGKDNNRLSLQRKGGGIPILYLIWMILTILKPR